MKEGPQPDPGGLSLHVQISTGNRSAARPMGGGGAKPRSGLIRPGHSLKLRLSRSIQAQNHLLQPVLVQAVAAIHIGMKILDQDLYCPRISAGSSYPGPQISQRLGTLGQGSLRLLGSQFGIGAVGAGDFQADRRCRARPFLFCVARPKGLVGRSPEIALSRNS